MTQLFEITRYFDDLLRIQQFQDFARNGLQIESQTREISRVAYAVDAGLSVIKRALSERAQLLVVHHGLFWGSGFSSLTGAIAEKVDALLRGGCSLYAAHLPLDAHMEIGNNACLAHMFGASQLEPFFEVEGQCIGVQACLPREVSMSELSTNMATCLKVQGTRYPYVLNFGKAHVQSLGIVSGSGSSALEACLTAGLDVLVSGEPKHEVYHRAQELRANAIFLGHYRTEIWGVRALCARLEKEYGVGSVFIDEETGI